MKKREVIAEHEVPGDPLTTIVTYGGEIMMSATKLDMPVASRDAELEYLLSVRPPKLPPLSGESVVQPGA